jgi:hypothetical protein
MSEVQSVLKKLREEVGECRILSNVATDSERRKLFTMVADRLTELASAVEHELAVVPAGVLGAAGQKPANMAVIADAADSAVVRATRPPRRHRWFLTIALLASAGVSAVGGAFITKSGEKDLLSPVEAKIVPPATPQQDAKEAMAEFRAAEENKQKTLSQQLDALAARFDSFEAARAESVEKARAEIVEPATKPDGVRSQRARHRRAASRTLRSGWGF